MRLRQRRRWALGPTALLLIGCASSGQTASGEPEDAEAGEVSSVSFEVSNDFTARRPVTVFVRSSAGERSLLGSVQPGQTRAFEFKSTSFTGTFQLIAQAPGFDDITSQPFSLFAGYTVSWRLAINATRVFAGTGGV